MEPLLTEIGKDVREIKTQVIELVKQGAIHNQILAQHERRSTNLEDRVKPIEDDYKFRHKLFILLIGGGGLVGIVLGILQVYQLMTEYKPH